MGNIGGSAVFRLHPNGQATVYPGETICLELDQLSINDTLGISFIEIDQQFAENEAFQYSDGPLGVMKTEFATIVEVDPVWTQDMPGYPTRFDLSNPGGQDVHWLNITNAPPFLTEEVDPIWVADRPNYPTFGNLRNPGESQVHWLNILDPPAFVIGSIHNF